MNEYDQIPLVTQDGEILIISIHPEQKEMHMYSITLRKIKTTDPSTIIRVLKENLPEAYQKFESVILETIG